MGVLGRLAWVVVVVGVMVGVVEGTSQVPNRGLNEIEEFVKKLEYEARRGEGGVYRVEGGVQVDLNLLPDDVIVRDVEEGLDEEFGTADEEQGGKEEDVKRNETDRTAENRQRSLIYQGVYAPDSRFNAFVDGVMVNMVAEMKRKAMDPLYLRVFGRGIVEHVAVSGRDSTSTSSTSTTPSSSSSTTRKGRQRGNAIGGGVIKGLTNIKRFGNAEVQAAGNTTLVRSHYVLGPINLELLFNTERGVRVVNSTLDALAAHAVAQVNDTSSAFIDLILDSPAPYEVHLEGAKSERYRRLSLSAVTRLFKPTGRLERRLKRAYVKARSKRVPDVTRGQSGNRRKGFGNGNAITTTTITPPTTPELP